MIRLDCGKIGSLYHTPHSLTAIASFVLLRKGFVRGLAETVVSPLQKGVRDFLRSGIGIMSANDASTLKDARFSCTMPTILHSGVIAHVASHE